METMKDYERELEASFRKINEGDILTGTVIAVSEEEIILDLKQFNDLPKVIKGKLLLYTINKVIGTTQGIEKVHIEDVIKLCKNNIGNKYLTPNKNIKIFVKKGKIFLWGN